MIRRLKSKLRDMLDLPPEHPLLRRQHDHFTNLDQERPIASYEFVVVDTELTGMHARNDEIVSIGAVRIRDLTILPDENFYSLVRPRSTGSKAATLVHRLTPQELAQAKPIREVLPDFLDFLGTSLIVGHYVNLDMHFLSRAVRDSLGSGLRNPCLDTLRLAQMYQEYLWETRAQEVRGNVSFNLGDLTQRFNLPAFTAHNALEDAFQAAYLFLYLMKKRKNNGKASLREVFLEGRSWRWYM